jgi:hypothetical protein
VKTPISMEDLELIALQQVRALPDGEFVGSARIECGGQKWALIVSAREGADLDRLQHSIRRVERNLQHRYKLRSE